MKLENKYLLFRRKNILFWISAPALYLLSIIYYVILLILKFAYKIHLLPSYRSKCKVISVGNITLGGTGKTPLVEWIADYLSREKMTVGVIIRGYKRPKIKKYNGIRKDSSYFEIGDEAGMLRENMANTNICVGRDKIKSAQELERRNCNIIILDDGFQHWRLERNLDIITIDSTFSILEQRLLPLGRLREPLSSLRRADIFVLTKTDLIQDNYKQRKEELKAIHPGALIVSSIYQPSCFFDLNTGDCLDIENERFKNNPVIILVGIVNPLYFDKLLSTLGLKIEREFIYPDHYEYTPKDVLRIKELAQNLNIDTIITTQKDAQRLRHLLDFIKPLNIFCLKIKLKITENEEEFCSRLLSVFNR